METTDKVPRDLPRAEALIKAEVWLKENNFPGQNAVVHFKFTCEKCGERCTLEEPNQLYERGTCCECGHETPLTMIGFMVVISRETVSDN